MGYFLSRKNAKLNLQSLPGRDSCGKNHLTSIGFYGKWELAAGHVFSGENRMACLDKRSSLNARVRRQQSGCRTNS
jgi:hypothetical protein